MKLVIYEDDEGFKQRRMIKTSDTPAMAEFGIPAGPPDLRQLNIEEVLKKVNENLVENELFTWDDVQRSNGAINAAVNIFRRELIRLYRMDDRNRQKRSS